MRLDTELCHYAREHQVNSKYCCAQIIIIIIASIIVIMIVTNYILLAGSEQQWPDPEGLSLPACPLH